MRYSIQDFIQLIAQLRNPNGGCPWDLKQNYDSMIPCLTEETYEVIDAIQKKDIAIMQEYARKKHLATESFFFAREIPLTFYHDTKNYYAEIYLPLKK